MKWARRWCRKARIIYPKAAKHWFQVCIFVTVFYWGEGGKELLIPASITTKGHRCQFIPRKMWESGMNFR